MPSHREVERFLSPLVVENPQANNNGWTYDPELGWIHKDSRMSANGIGGSDTFYQYELNGSRKVIGGDGRSCRIQTFGNSFTHCDQVNDGETWQTYLACHLCEPLENYGVGGYSVYQAYRRMVRVQKTQPADYIILNIWTDDHFRNLDSWRSIRFGVRTPGGFTLPYLIVDAEEGSCVEVENICSRPEQV